MVLVHRRWLVLLVGLATVLAGPGARAETPQTVPVVVETAGGEYLFRAEVAATPEERSMGLMHREHLEPDAGMLFLFEQEQLLAFWMRNTFIPLDMLFIDRAGRIVHIAKMTEPHSEASQQTPVPALVVLEINGGLSDRLGIDVGDRVRSPALAP